MNINKKKYSMSLALLLGVVLALSSCKQLGGGKDDDDDTQNMMLLGLLYIADQNSGNCVTITKSASENYSASISVVPKGGCKLSLTVDDSKAAYKALLYKQKEVFEKSGSGCSTLSAAYTDTAINNTVNNITTAFHTEAKNKAAFVGNLIEETNTTLKQSYSEAQISAMTLGSLDDWYAKSAYDASSSDAGCRTAIVSTYPNVAKIITSPPTMLVSGSCTYGSSASATTQCATLSEKY